MRRNSQIHAAVLAAVVAGTVFATGVASAHGGGKKPLKLVGTQLQSQFVDVGTTGPSLGDQFVFSQRLRARGRHVGMSGAVCTLTHVVPPYDVLTVQCVSTLSLRRGQITLQGLLEVQGVSDPGPFTLAVTGGTGAYRGATGEAVIRGSQFGTRTYKLRLDKPKQHRRGHDRHH